MDDFPGEWQIKDFVIAVFILLAILGAELSTRHQNEAKETELKSKVELLEKECGR